MSEALGVKTESCTCYDGPLSSADPSLVSIRCRDHQARPPLVGHRWIRRDPILGELRINEWYVNRKRYGMPKRRVLVAPAVVPRLTKAEKAQRKAERRESARIAQLELERQQRELEAAEAEAAEMDEAA